MSIISESIVNNIEFHIEDSFFIELYKRRLRTYKDSFATVPINADLNNNSLYLTNSSFQNISNSAGLLLCFNTLSDYSSHDDLKFVESLPSLSIEIDFTKNDLKKYAKDLTKYVIFTYIDLSDLICYYRISLLSNFSFFDYKPVKDIKLALNSAILPPFEKIYLLTEKNELEGPLSSSNLPKNCNEIAVLSEKEAFDKTSLPLANLLSYLFKKSNLNELIIHFIGKNEQKSVKLGVKNIEKWQIALNLFDGKRSLDKPEVDVRDLVSNLHFELALWRVIPELDLTKFENLSVAILGMGTLGCSIALQLVNWGIRTLTLVDSGRVSYTNIGRQLLYSPTDAVSTKFIQENRRWKVEAAEEYLVKIYPNLNIKTYKLDIPMLGNTSYLNDLSKLEKSVKVLSEIVYNNDVIFMVTDTRESRWLPSLLISRRNREEWSSGRGVLGVVASLGFDSCLVTRQSFGKFKASCYFCGDVTGASSTVDSRPNDELCTITRPGISQICASLAVELVATLTQSKDGFASEHSMCTTSISCLGVTPQTIRLNLSNMNISSYHNEVNNKCICCSETIIEAFNEDNIEFLKYAIAKPELLNILTGLDKVKVDDVIVL